MLKLKIALCFVIISNFILSINNIYSQSGIINSSTAKTILRTDSIGNILGGDLKDWSFNKKHYHKRKLYNYLFRTPAYKDSSSNIFTNEYNPFTYEIMDEGVLIKWLTATEKNCEGFYVERAKIYGESRQNWVSLGYVEGAGNSDKEINYEFLDNDVENFAKYNYRLKQIDFNGKYYYYSLGSEVFVKLPNVFEFYPTYSNPVTDIINVSFYLPKKEVVSLFFMNGNDTAYILDNEPEERGFYKLSLDKISLGYKNEIKRLYIDCESCNKKKNFGNVQFN